MRKNKYLAYQKDYDNQCSFLNLSFGTNLSIYCFMEYWE